MESRDVESAGLLPPSAAAVYSYFSEQEKALREGGGASKKAQTVVHTPLGASAEHALEVGVLALCGRVECPRRRAVFAAAATAALGVCALAAYAYPRDPDFLLTPLQKGFGFVGVFAVLGGANALACVWFKGLFCRCTTREAALAAAHTLLVFCEDGSQHTTPVLVRRGPSGAGERRCAAFRHVRFVYDGPADAFLPEASTEPLADATALGIALDEGLPAEVAAARLSWHGPNLIDVPMPTIPRQLADEVLNPFVFFQFFSCVQWCLQKYWRYAIIVVLITLLAAIVSIVISRQNFRRLRELSRNEAHVSVRRDGAFVTLLSTELVPGDVFVIEEEQDMPCDAVLVAGECLMSEAMLTGESVPVAKAVGGVKALLSGGTRVLQTRGASVLARVARTGFATEKGRLIRSILFPRAGRMDLTRDGNRFVSCVLLPMAVAGGIASCVHALHAGHAFTVASALDLVSIAVPPALPAAMMIGIATAVSRLRRKAIFCIAPTRVNMAGRITRVCFDKTGTLTFDGLTLLALLPLEQGSGAAAFPGGACAAAVPPSFAEEVPAAATQEACGKAAAAAALGRLTLVMAACQSLRLLASSLVGDPLEVVMLESTGWVIEAERDGFVRVRAPQGGGARLLQAFDFNSELARMAMAVRLDGAAQGSEGAHEVLVKGSPEAVAALCRPDTVPPAFEATLALYAGRGYRVLGCASRLLDAEEAAAAERGTLTRAAAEAPGRLAFVGLVVMENRLKPTSASIIAALQAAEVSVAMVTGDHARTAVTVARAANILTRTARVVVVDAVKGGGAAATYLRLALEPGEADEPLSEAEALGAASVSCRFAATGAGFDALLAAAEAGHPGALNTVLDRLSVAARFQPQQKQRVVTLYIERGEYTAFVGDGANDSAALKAADVGLSLTADAEASVAAPFTSKDADLGAIVTLLLEGRAALATGFQLFKYMALYASTQFACSLQMNLAGTYLSEYQFLYVDLAIVLPLSGLIPQTRAYSELTSRQPPSSLLHWAVITSVAGQAALVLAFQLAVRALTRHQCWWRPQDFQCCGSAAAAVSSRCSSAAFAAPSPPTCVPCSESFETIVPSYENTALWHLANFQYLHLVAAFGVARPFRQPQWTNAPFTLLMATLVATSAALLFVPSSAMDAFFLLVPLPDYNFRFVIAFLVLLGAGLAFALESGIEAALEEEAAGRGPAAVLRRLRRSHVAPDATPHI